MPVYVDTIVCDIIRQEANNKVSLLGVFGRAILVPKIPTQLPSLGFVQRWEPTADEPEGTKLAFTFEIRCPGIELPIKLEGSHTSIGPGPYPYVNIAIQIQGFPIPKQGDYQFVTFIDGQERKVYNFFVGIPTEDQLGRFKLTGFR